MRTRHALPALVAVAALMLSGCADNSVPVAGGSTGSASASDVKKDDAAAALLPDKIAKSGKLVIATSPNYAPNEFKDNAGKPIGWAIEVGDAPTALGLAAGLWRFWQKRGYITEGQERLDAALALPGCEDELLRLAALDAAGGLAYWNNDQLRARQHYEEALAIQRARDDRVGIADALYNLSFTHTFKDEAAMAEVMVLEAIELQEAAGNELGVARAKWALANIEYTKGREGALRARELALDSLAIFERHDERFMIGWATYTAGVAEFITGRMEEARARLLAALRMFRDTIDVSGYTLVLDTLAALTDQRGDPIRAARIAGAVDTLERTTGTALNRTNRGFFGYDPEPLRVGPATAEAFAAGMGMDTQAALDFAMDTLSTPG